MATVIAAYEPRDLSSTTSYKVIAEPLETSSLRSTTIPMPKTCPLMCSASFTLICSVTSWPMVFFVWDVTPAKKKSRWLSAVSGTDFAPHM
jgi:hypothetical protein